MATITATVDNAGHWTFDNGSLFVGSTENITVILTTSTSGASISFLASNPLSWFDPGNTDTPEQKPDNFGAPELSADSSSLVLSDTVSDRKVFGFKINALYTPPSTSTSPSPSPILLQSPDPTIINVDTGGVFPILPVKAQGTTTTAH